MEGLPVVIKFPHIAILGSITLVLVEGGEGLVCYEHINAFVKSGPWFGVGGPKEAVTSLACKAPITEYWYLYPTRP